MQVSFVIPEEQADKLYFLLGFCEQAAKNSGQPEIAIMAHRSFERLRDAERQCIPEKEKPYAVENYPLPKQGKAPE